MGWGDSFCYVLAEEGKRFSLVFPDGRGFLRGWNVLVEKLHLLEVVLKAETKIVGSTTEKWRSSLVDSKKGSYVEAVKKDLRMVGEAVWVQIGEWDVQSRLDQLNCCPVGRFEEDPKSKPDLLSLRNWVTNL